jgi:hypothetical protein
MNEARIVKKMFEEKLEGRRERGRPRLRWINDVEVDEKVEKESIGERGMGVRYKGSQGQTERTVELQEEEEEEEVYCWHIQFLFVNTTNFYCRHT